jgi:hypothetical protein
MYYQWHNSYRFKPAVNSALSQYEITVSSDFVVGEPYLIELQCQTTCNGKMINNRVKGVFVRIFNGSNMTHIICKDKYGRSFSAPAQESRFYKSPNHIINNRLRQQCVVYAINNLTTSAMKHTYMQNSIGYELGKGWIWNDTFIEKWYKDEEKNNKNEQLHIISNT